MISLKYTNNEAYQDLILEHSKDLFSHLDEDVESYISQQDEGIQDRLYACNDLIIKVKREVKKIKEDNYNIIIKHIISAIFHFHKKHHCRTNQHHHFYKQCIGIWIDLLEKSEYFKYINTDAFNILKDYWSNNHFYLLCYNYIDYHHTIATAHKLLIVNVE